MSYNGGSKKNVWDEAADIVIVGAGGTGLVAAVEASENDNTVIVLEKGRIVGGSTLVSGGVIQAAGTKCQKEMTKYKDDTTQKHYEYWMQSSEGIADPELVKILADSGPANIEWLMAHGLSYSSIYGVDRIPYIDASLMVDRIHVPDGGGKRGGKVHINALYEAAQKGGAQFFLETTGEKLICDENGGVIGIVAGRGDEKLRIKATKAVILATSGFDHSKDMARALSPHQYWAIETNVVNTPRTITGDGIRMARALGADLAGIVGTISFIPDFNVALGDVPGIFVNKNGNRFVDETCHYGFVMREVFNQVGHEVWTVFDDKTRQMGGDVIGSRRMSWSKDLNKEIEDGKIITAPTVKELAAIIGVNASNLVSTVNRWNGDASDGVDTQFNKKRGLRSIDKAPFYAVKVKESNLGTCGGLKINTKAQVIDVESRVIPRLYAGGMCAGGFIGPYYPGSGTAIAATVCFGRICAQNAVVEQPWG